MAVDFEAEGLLEGVNPQQREARLKLLGELSADGASTEELREAVAANRLTLLPAERALRGTGERLTRAELAKRSGLSVELLERMWRSMGMPEPGDDERAFTDDDVEAASRVKQLMDAGIPEQGILEINRVLGVTMSQVAAALSGVGRRALLQPSDSERETGMRMAAAARDLMPVFTPALEYALRLHARDQLASAAVDQVQLGGALEGGMQIAVCFADLVDFTKLGERLEVSEVGELTDRLSEMVAEVAGRRVRLVKLIGDAAMLTSTDPTDLAVTALELVGAAEREQNFPQLRAGVALGEVLPRGGDFYGRPVNLASRITAIARPGSVLCSEALHDQLADDQGLRFSYARKRQLKGIGEPQKLFHVRYADGEKSDAGGERA
ncbi:MAG: hypothetical protein H0W09_01985 [Solirubrobacterales bacterium]|nr:hypothetical protein [Solirubrobacterales bacterium]